ncbi:MAG: T9SS type A sorting domain-containing protein, partial [Planctomycetes bacterium]|nr:T9SS type A sorting domain-containing protein [Planctomycetota bacterium]
TLSHYHARMLTLLYVDGLEAGSLEEQLVPTQFALGGPGYAPGQIAPTRADYKEWLIYRSALNPDEVEALYNETLLQSSLELYAPLDAEGASPGDSLINLAQSTTAAIAFSELIAIEKDQGSIIPGNFRLYQNYPNPFNPETKICYNIPQKSNVDLTIYNLLGQKVRTLVDDNQAPGPKSIVWDGRNGYGDTVSSGVYLYQIKAGNEIQDRKMLLLK